MEKRMRNRHLKSSLLVVLMGLWSFDANAMLVAYKDSFGIMGVNQAFHNELFLNYSLTSDFAVGARWIRFLTTNGEAEFAIPEADFLLKRWNAPDSQANIYLGGGYGAETFAGQTQGVGMANFAADWENRKY